MLNLKNREDWEKLLSELNIGDVIVIHEIDRLGWDNKEIKERFELIGEKKFSLNLLINRY